MRHLLQVTLSGASGKPTSVWGELVFRFIHRSKFPSTKSFLWVVINRVRSCASISANPRCCNGVYTLRTFFISVDSLLEAINHSLYRLLLNSTQFRLHKVLPYAPTFQPKESFRLIASCWCNHTSACPPFQSLRRYRSNAKEISTSEDSPAPTRWENPTADWFTFSVMNIKHVWNKSNAALAERNFSIAQAAFEVFLLIVNWIHDH